MPILKEHCFECHGPDEEAREADLRLDIADRDGSIAIVPGDPNASDLIFLIQSDIEDERMPPPKSKKIFTYRFQGRDFRLTDVHGHVVKDIIA